jgi:hypothetical protein
MDPLQPIPPGPATMPSRRVPPVPGLPRVSREGDKPRRDPSEREPAGHAPNPYGEDEETGEGHVDVRV